MMLTDASKAIKKTRLPHKLKQRIIGSIIAFYSCNSFAQADTENQCSSQANTKLEHTLCEIKTKGSSTSLPSLNEFRKNDARMQYLLLKRPAKRLGITLPKPSSAKPKPKPASISQTYKKPAIITKNGREKTQPTVNINNKLDECTLLNDRLKCPFSNYDLVTNAPLRNLDRTSLSSNNTLSIEKATKADQSDLRYNTQVYRTYIEKMLSIGLGYSTMSFTKFSYIYNDSIAQGHDFPERMFDMFELLKTERKTNGIKARYDNKIPESISWCMNLSEALIVCDNKEQNWVYKKTY